MLLYSINKRKNTYFDRLSSLTNAERNYEAILFLQGMMDIFHFRVGAAGKIKERSIFMKRTLKKAVSLTCALAIVTAIGLTVFAGSWSLTNTNINSRGFNLSATSTKYTSQLVATYTIQTFDGQPYNGTMNTQAHARYSNGNVGPWQGTKTGTNVKSVTGTTSWIPGVGQPSSFEAQYGVNGSYTKLSNQVFF